MSQCSSMIDRGTLSRFVGQRHLSSAVWHLWVLVAIGSMACAAATAQCAIPDAASDSQGEVLLSDDGFLGPDHQLYTGLVKLVPMRDGHPSGAATFITVVGGRMRVRLGANEPGSNYVAIFLERNRVVDVEQWCVPRVSFALTVNDINVGRASQTELEHSLYPFIAGATINESDVIGLVADLGARPMRGPGSAPNRVTVTDELGALSSATGSLADCVRVDGTSGPCGDTGQSLGGDISGTLSSVTVSGIQNHFVAPIAPADGQALVYSAATGSWAPKAISAVSSSPLGGDISGTLSSVTVSGIQNHFVAPIAPADGQVLVYSAATASWAPKAISAVSSPPLGGDISGTLSSVTVSGIQNHFVAPIAPADGQVLVYSGATASWAPQAISAVSSPPLGGDVSGALSSVRVSGIQDHSVAPIAPADGQALVYSALGNSWKPLTASDAWFSLVRTSDTLLTLGSSCSVSMPCSVRIGTLVFVFRNPMAISIGPSSGTGSAFFYIDDSGLVQVSSNMTNLSCSPSSSCAVMSASNFVWPTGALPLWVWNGSGGIWNDFGTDMRSPMSTLMILPGSGVLTIDSGSRMIIAVDPATQPQIWQAQATLNFGTIANSTCAPSQVIPLAGTLPNDPVIPGWPGSLPMGVIGQMQTTSLNQVSVTLCNFTGVDQSPGPLLFQAAVLRQFSYVTLPPSEGSQQGLAAPTRKLSIDATAGSDGPVEGIEYCYTESGEIRESCADVKLPHCQPGCTVTLQVPEGHSLKYNLYRAGGARRTSKSNWLVVSAGSDEIQH